MPIAVFTRGTTHKDYKGKPGFELADQFRLQRGLAQDCVGFRAPMTIRNLPTFQPVSFVFCQFSFAGPFFRRLLLLSHSSRTFWYLSASLWSSSSDRCSMSIISFCAWSIDLMISSSLR
jgi:hypothetical protein